MQVFYCGMLIKHHYDPLTWNINSILKNWLIIIIKTPLNHLTNDASVVLKMRELPAALISMVMHAPHSAPLAF